MGWGVDYKRRSPASHMSHVLCHSLFWPQNRGALPELSALAEKHEARIILLGGLARTRDLKSLAELREALEHVPLHVIPRDDDDRTVAELLNLPLLDNCEWNGVWCSADGRCPRDRVYSSRRVFAPADGVVTPADVPALVPTTYDEYKACRAALVIGAGGAQEYVPIEAGPRLLQWKPDEPPPAPRPGDLVCVWHPTPLRLARLRNWKRVGVRVRVVHRPPEPLLDFDTFLTEFVAHNDLQDVATELRRRVSDRLEPAPRVRLTRLTLENVGTVRSSSVDLTRTGLVRVESSNGSGKATVYRDALLFALTGVWRRFEGLDTLCSAEATEASVTLMGVARGDGWVLRHRVTSHEHALTARIGTLDITGLNPAQTLTAFHRACFGMEHGSAHDLFFWWSTRLVGDRPELPPVYDDASKRSTSQRHAVALRAVWHDTLAEYEEQRQSFDTTRRLVRRCVRQRDAIRELMDRTRASERQWRAHRRILTACMRYTLLRPPTPPVLRPPGDREALSAAVDEAMDELTALRARYFEAVRARREMAGTAPSVPVRLEDAEVRHARQERDARQAQASSLHTRVNAFIALQRAEARLSASLREQEVLERRRRAADASEAIMGIMAAMSRRIEACDAAKRRLEKYDQALARFQVSERRRRRRASHERLLEQLRTQASPVAGTRERLEASLAEQESCLERLRMREEEVRTRLARAERLRSVRQLSDAWRAATMTALDQRMGYLWTAAGWGDDVTFHAERLYRAGAPVVLSASLRDRCALVALLAHKELFPALPMMVLKDAVARQDASGVRGMQRLVERWCEGHPRRTCWWLARGTE